VGEIRPGLMLDLSGVDLDANANAPADQAGYEYRWLIDPDRDPERLLGQFSHRRTRCRASYLRVHVTTCPRRRPVAWFPGGF
jgi:hypothetical protein